MRKIILIGGAPGSGKSTLAKLLASHYKVPLISTDDIRELMQQFASPKKYPNLFSDNGFTPEEYFKKYPTTKQVVEQENLQSKVVQISLKYLILNDVINGNFIIEGVAITPEFVKELTKEGLKAIFIVQENKEVIRDIVYKRGVWDDAKKYSDKVKDFEVEWVVEFNNWLKSECKKFNFEPKVNNSREELVLYAKNIVGEAL